MRRKLPLAAAVLALSGTAPAAAQDEVVVRDEHRVVSGQLLDGIGVYQRLVPRRERRTKSHWMRLVDGRARPVRALPPGGAWSFNAIGRDGNGRVVVPVIRWRRVRDRLVEPRWLLYDVAGDALRPLTGLPGGACTPTYVAAWRTRLAYHLDCPERAGVYLRDGRGARRVSRKRISDATAPLILRGGTVVMTVGAGDAGYAVWQLTRDGRRCEHLMKPSSGRPGDWVPREAWLHRGRVSWWMETVDGSLDPPPAGNLILGARLGRGCSRPGPTGSHAPVHGLPLAMDGDDLYYGVGRTVVRRDVSAGPSTEAPPNDAFADAAEVTGPLPLTFGARVGYGIRDPSDPLVTSVVGTERRTATRTLWYAYRPTALQRLSVTFRWFGSFEGRVAPVGVFEQDASGRLTELPQLVGESGTVVTFRADPAHRYFLAVGCDAAGPCFPSFTITIGPATSA